MLAGLLRDPRCVEVFEACGASVKDLKQRLDTLLAAEDRPTRHDGSTEPRPTPEIERVVQAATVHALSDGRDVVNTSDALIAICGEGSSQAVLYLQAEGMIVADLLQAAAQRKGT